MFVHLSNIFASLPHIYMIVPMISLIMLNLCAAISQSFVKPYALHDDDTCWVNHHLNAWFCTNANHIPFSMCLLFLLLLKESQDGATLESAHFELLDDECLVIDHFDTTPPYISHGDLVFDPRSDLSQGGGRWCEHPMDITMSRVHLASDTCDIYFAIHKGESSPLHVLTWPLRGWCTTWHFSRVHA